MKRHHHITLTLIALLTLVVGSCGEKEKPRVVSTSTEQIVGKWQRNGTQEYWRYKSDYTGITWDESDDISETESNLTYTWSISEGELTHVFTGARNNQMVPKTYGIISIGESEMVWEDDYGQMIVLNRQ